MVVTSEEALINDTIADKPKIIYQDELTNILYNIDLITGTLNKGVDSETQKKLVFIRERLITLIESASIVKQ